MFAGQMLLHNIMIKMTDMKKYMWLWVAVLVCGLLCGCDPKEDPVEPDDSIPSWDDDEEYDEPVTVSNGLFSVSESRQVYFSAGNLQYKASSGTWRIAPKQYECIGDDNARIGASYDGWIDLFGWGTSGWSSGANAYQPYATNNMATDYTPGGNASNNLTGSYANSDWGVYNIVSNLSPTSGWRTLTQPEWGYLLGSAGKRFNKWGAATVDSRYRGIVILPDDWTQPSKVNFTAGNGQEYNTNMYTLKQWERMESAGAKFLPAAGYRVGTSVYGVGTYGYYWSASAKDENYAFGMNFYATYLTGQYPLYRDYGRSVRLVRDK